MTPAQIDMAKRLMADPALSIERICQTLKISRSTLYRYCPSPFTQKAQKTKQATQPDLV